MVNVIEDTGGGEKEDDKAGDVDDDLASWMGLWPSSDKSEGDRRDDDEAEEDERGRREEEHRKERIRKRVRRRKLFQNGDDERERFLMWRCLQAWDGERLASWMGLGDN